MRERGSLVSESALEYARALGLCTSVARVRLCAPAAPVQLHTLQNMACAQACVFGERGAGRAGRRETDVRVQRSSVKSWCAGERVRAASAAVLPLLKGSVLPLLRLRPSTPLHLRGNVWDSSFSPVFASTFPEIRK